MTMKSPVSFPIIKRFYYGILLTILAGFAGCLAYAYVAFTGALIAKAPSEEPMRLLQALQPKKFESALAHFEARRNLPAIPDDLPNPFDALAR